MVMVAKGSGDSLKILFFVRIWGYSICVLILGNY